MEAQAAATTNTSITSATASGEDVIEVKHSSRSLRTATPSSTQDALYRSGTSSKRTFSQRGSPSPPSTNSRPASSASSSIDQYTYQPHQHPVPCLSSRPSHTSPSYGKWHIDSSVIDERSGREFYVLIASNPRAHNPSTGTSIVPSIRTSSQRSRPVSAARSTSNPNLDLSIKVEQTLRVAVQDITLHVSAAELESYELGEHRRRSAEEELQRLLELSAAANRWRYGHSAANDDAESDASTGVNLYAPKKSSLKRGSTAASDQSAAKRQHTGVGTFKGTGTGGHWKVKREEKARQERLARAQEAAAQEEKVRAERKGKTNAKQQQPVEQQEEEEEAPYEVEGILADWTDERSGTRIYMVKWQGYDDPTEEPEENLEGSEEILQEYEDRKTRATDEAMREALSRSKDAFVSRKTPHDMDDELGADHEVTPRRRERAVVVVRSPATSTFASKFAPKSVSKSARKQDFNALPDAEMDAIANSDSNQDEEEDEIVLSHVNGSAKRSGKSPAKRSRRRPAPNDHDDSNNDEEDDRRQANAHDVNDQDDDSEDIIDERRETPRGALAAFVTGSKPDEEAEEASGSPRGALTAFVTGRRREHDEEAEGSPQGALAAFKARFSRLR